MNVDFTRIFGAAFSYPLKRDAYLVFFTVQLVFAIISWFVVGYLGLDLVGPDDTFLTQNAVIYASYMVPIMLAGIVANTFLLPALIENSANFSKGKRKKIAEGFAASKKRFVDMIGLSAIMGIVMLACFGGLLMIMFSEPDIFTPEGFVVTAVGGLWFIAGGIVAAVFGFMAFLSPVFCAMDKAGPLESIRKSWRLIAKNKADTLFFLIIFFAAYLAVAVVGSFPESLYTLLYGYAPALSMESFAFMVVRSAVNSYIALFAISSAVSYYLNIKK